MVLKGPKEIIFDQSSSQVSPSSTIGVDQARRKVTKLQAVGLVAVVLAVALVVLALILGAGLLGGGKMYYLAAGVAVGAVILGLVGTYLLRPKAPKIITTGSPNLIHDSSDDKEVTYGSLESDEE